MGRRMAGTREESFILDNRYAKLMTRIPTMAYDGANSIMEKWLEGPVAKRDINIGIINRNLGNETKTRWPYNEGVNSMRRSQNTSLVEFTIYVLKELTRTFFGPVVR